MFLVTWTEQDRTTHRLSIFCRLDMATHSYLELENLPPAAGRSCGLDKWYLSSRNLDLLVLVSTLPTNGLI